jgi:outer membrane protein OmpA-like peptidoglycan-associated protein
MTLTVIVNWGTVFAADVFTADQIAYVFSSKKALGEPATVNLPTVTFEFDSDRLRPQAERQLDELAKALNYPSFEGTPFLIAGHTDASGSAAYNQRLSERRAESVRRYLASEHQFSDTRMATTGYGEDRPLPDLAPLADDQRRVEITLR